MLWLHWQVGQKFTAHVGILSVNCFEERQYEWSNFFRETVPWQGHCCKASRFWREETGRRHSFWWSKVFPPTTCMSIVHTESWQGLSLRDLEAAFSMQSRLHSEWSSVARQMTLFRRRRERMQFRREGKLRCMLPQTQHMHDPQRATRAQSASSACTWTKVQDPRGRKPTGGESPTTQEILRMQMCLNQNFCICRPKLLHLQTGNQKFDHTPPCPNPDRNWMNSKGESPAIRAATGHIAGNDGGLGYSLGIYA